MRGVAWRSRRRAPLLRLLRLLRGEEEAGLFVIVAAWAHGGPGRGPALTFNEG